ncbi:MAG TPA: hypothetical protein VNO82_07850 [Solirubrobacteraceae bacterium]|nr:hypothetical protein [Solirubrobacteraceae bacterium]
MGVAGTRRAIVVATTLIALAAPACGDDNAGGSETGSNSLAPSTGEQPPQVPAPPPPPSPAAAARWPVDEIESLSPDPKLGTLTKPDGTTVRGWGEPRLRRYLAAVFARIQYDFRAGEMAGACKHVDDTLLAGFPPGRDISHDSCARKLRTYAADLERRGFEPRPLRLLWVRAYPGFVGRIWVQDVRGQRFRIPFADKGDAGWRLELGKLERPDALGLRLTGLQR